MIPSDKCLKRRSRLTLAVLWGVLATTAGATMNIEPPAEQRIDADAQKALAVTIYNDNLALVKDQRSLSLTQGENRLAWRNVSAKIRPETALLSETSGRLPVMLLEQNFDFDLLNGESLLKKYDGDQAKALAAYNAGPGRVDKGGPLPQETQGYVAKIMMKLKGDKHDKERR